MKRRFLLKISLFVVATVVLLTACTSKNLTPPAVSLVDAGPAQVTQVEVLDLSSVQPQLRVVAYGKLPDACTSIGSVTSGRSGDTFNFQIAAKRLEGVDCPGGGTDFERVLPIDVEGLAPGSYQVSVNGVDQTFTIQAGGAIASGQVEATPTASGQAVAQLLVTPTPALTEQPAVTQAPPATTEAPTANTPAATPPAATPASPSPTATEAAAATATGQQAASSGACTNKAAFYGDVTVPDDTQFRQGDKFTKTWKLRNDGTCAWDSGYSLVFANGDMMSGPVSESLPTAEPGQIVEISVDLTAPTAGGTLVGNWMLQNAAGQRFGTGINADAPIWVRIVVNWVNNSQNSTGGGQSSTGQTSAGTPACPAQRNTDYEQQVLALINSARTAQGLNELSLQPQLSAAAYAHSLDMACNNFVDHTGSDGSRWSQRVAAQGYKASYVEENIYVGNPDFGGTPQGAFDWWMGDQIHRDNILSNKVTEIGIGYAYDANSTYGGYYTVDFAKP